MKTKKQLIYLPLLLMVCLLAACKPSAKSNDNNNDLMEKEIKIKMETNYGDMVLKLYNETPKHRGNVVKLGRGGHDSGLLVHLFM